MESLCCVFSPQPADRNVWEASSGVWRGPLRCCWPPVPAVEERRQGPDVGAKRVRKFKRTAGKEARSENGCSYRWQWKRWRCTPTGFYTNITQMEHYSGFRSLAWSYFSSKRMNPKIVRRVCLSPRRHGSVYWKQTDLGLFISHKTAICSAATLDGCWNVRRGVCLLRESGHFCKNSFDTSLMETCSGGPRRAWWIFCHDCENLWATTASCLRVDDSPSRQEGVKSFICVYIYRLVCRNRQKHSDYFP